MARTVRVVVAVMRRRTGAVVRTGCCTVMSGRVGTARKCRHCQTQACCQNDQCFFHVEPRGRAGMVARNFALSTKTFRRYGNGTTPSTQSRDRSRTRLLICPAMPPLTHQPLIEFPPELRIYTALLLPSVLWFGELCDQYADWRVRRMHRKVVAELREAGLIKARNSVGAGH